MTSYPSLSVIVPGPHLSFALAKIALDDVPALNFKTTESQTRMMSSLTCKKRRFCSLFAWQGLVRICNLEQHDHTACLYLCRLITHLRLFSKEKPVL